MLIDFFRPECKTTTQAPLFGLCDDEATCAYIDTDSPTDWLGEIMNKTEKEIEFVAIDKCLNIKDKEGNQESTCDCLLRNGKQLIFVELKSWKKGGWVKKGREQIVKTIALFKTTHKIDKYEVKAHICNNRKPFSNSGHAVNIQKFKDETGYILSTNKTLVNE